MAAPAALYHGIWGEWEYLAGMAKCGDPPGSIAAKYDDEGYLDESMTLKSWALVTTLLTTLNLFVTVAAAMLGAAVAARVRAGRAA